LNVIECPEFRALLKLLRNDLKETMVPHRSKMRELIIVAWRRYFQVLKVDLEVIFRWSIICFLLIFI
jgi:hypothetical protein